MLKVPVRYIPGSLSKKDRLKQKEWLKKSRKEYKRGVFVNRPIIKSFTSKKSGHVENARRIYGVERISPSRELSKKTGCSVSGLKQIVKKGEGAYYSSGSRPSQTAQSWGFARLASAVTGGKSALVDMHILEKECRHDGRAYRFAMKAKKKYGSGQRKTKKVIA